MNYITNKICEHLDWLENMEETTEANHSKAEKYFSPHAFRYTISTLFSEMGVPKDTIKFLLLHSRKDLGSLEPYILSVNKHIEELKAAQLLLETVLETALELDLKHNIQLDFKQLLKDLRFAYHKQLYNDTYVDFFREQIRSQAAKQILGEGNHTVFENPLQEGNPYANPGMLQQMQILAQMQMNATPFIQPNTLPSQNLLHQLMFLKQRS